MVHVVTYSVTLLRSAFHPLILYFVLFLRYAWILLVVLQLVMSNVSLLGHLCGILSGFACMLLWPLLTSHPHSKKKKKETLKSLVVRVECFHNNYSLVADTYGLFNFLVPGPSFYSSIESSTWLVSTSSMLLLIIFYCNIV